MGPLERKQRSCPPGVPPTFFVTFLGAIVGEKALHDGILRGPWHQRLLFQQPQQTPCLVRAGQRADLWRSRQTPLCCMELWEGSRPLASTTHYKHVTHRLLHASACCLLLTPCGGGRQQIKRKRGPERDERSPQQNLIPRTHVQSPKTEGLLTQASFGDSSILFLSEVTRGLGEPHIALIPWASPLRRVK